MNRMMCAAVVVAVTAAGAVGEPVRAQRAAGLDTVRYEIGFPNASRHEAEITVSYTNLPDGPLQLRMSRSSPGRYAIHEFAKNVYNVRAIDGRGRPLEVRRPDPYQWDVHGHDGTVRVSYTLFANHIDGTYAGISLAHAHLNIPATFMWARGTYDRPVAVRFLVPPDADWIIATQLRPTPDPAYYTAPHFHYFMDSPTVLAPFAVRAWEESGGGRTQTIRIAMHHLGTDAELDEYAAQTQRIVQEQRAVFGELPEFDYGTYTFLSTYVPWAAGDGMEHRNSTILTSGSSLGANMIGLLGTVSHEFFHAWNVERIRPRSLEPFDFEGANMARELWFAEGFTSYYGPLTMRRAGTTDDRRWLGTLSGMVNTVANSPGRHYFSPVEMSMQAPFVDAATAVDPNNRANTFISYYTWGAAIGLGLDLTLRTRHPGLSLDDFMRAVWREYGAQSDHAPVRTYTVDDLRRILGAVVNDTSFANEFFRRYITGREVVDYPALLAHAGILVRPTSPGTPTLGSARLVAQDGAVVVTTPTLRGTSLYSAGVSLGDRVLALDGVPVATVEEVQAAVAAHRPGDLVAITFEQRGVRRTAEVNVGAATTLELLLFEDAGMPVTPEIRSFREAWLGPKRPGV